jgi:MoaA/NifB/PqqE/SkfB family radical SAM enzyme
MNVSNLLSLGYSHARNSAAQAIYLTHGIDLTSPVTFHALVNERCNCRCRHCEYWRQKEYVPEMTIEQWQNALLSIKEFVGPFSVSFSGGEPFMKKGFIGLLQFCHDNAIHAGVTTNGALLNERNVPSIVAARPFNVNISLDSHLPAVHDHVRGMPGLLDRITRGIGLLRQEQQRQGVTFPIIVKPTIMSVNFRQLPQIVHWSLAAGATALNFQPLGKWTPETEQELWINEPEWAELDRIMQQLIDLKRAGAPIMNSEEVLRLMTASFREEKASPEHLPCRIGLQELYIRPDGEVKLCFHFPAIGNLTTQSAREIWKGPEARAIRAATVKCDKLCLLTCLSHKSLGNRVSQALTLLSRQRSSAMTTTESYA